MAVRLPRNSSDKSGCPLGSLVNKALPAIVEQLQKRGQCSIMDIKAMGFLLDDIARYWPEACRIAERKSRMTM
jgi:hypothetical protein